jgi:hypothetical protein
LLALMMIAGSARAATDCPAGDDVRSQAECVHDQMSPDVIDKLYRLALSTLNGKLDPGEVPQDFLYIAEEAGEAARRKGPKPLVEMARSGDMSKLAFAARALTAFLDAVRHGHSHRHRFEDDGDAKLYADAKRVLRAPCKRLAAHDNEFLRAEGERCLRDLAPKSPLSQFFDGSNADFSGVRGVPVSSGGGLRSGSPGSSLSSRPAPAPRASKPSRKTGPPSQETEAR